MPENTHSSEAGARAAVPMQATDQFSFRRLALFLFLTAALSCPFYFLHAYSKSPAAGVYIRGLMWSPAIAALITLRLTTGGVKAIGWAWPKRRFLVASYFIPSLYIALAYVPAWIAGWGRFPDWQFVNQVGAIYAWQALPAWLVIPVYTVVTAAIGIIPNLSLALGEEIGWRGFLAPELAKRFSYAWTSFISGLIWALWHFPLMFIHQLIDRDALYGAGCFLISITGIAFAITWLQLRSGSVWCAAIFHASHNLFDGLAGSLTAETKISKYVLDESGILMAIAGVVVAVIFYFFNKKRPAVKPVAEHALL